MTPEDSTKALLLLAMFAGQFFLMILMAALQREDFPAPFWRWMERAYETITIPVVLAVEWTAAKIRTSKGQHRK